MISEIIKMYRKHCDRYYKKYIEIYGFFSCRPRLASALAITSKLLTASVYCAYVFLLAITVINRGLSERLLRIILVPAIAFAAVTLVRKKINAPRPYEKYPIVPVVHKSTKGNSCPSRHSACAFIIALACLYAYPFFGIAMLADAFFVAGLRPVMGVHFPYDVIFGAALSLTVGIIGFWAV